MEYAPGAGDLDRAGRDWRRGRVRTFLSCRAGFSSRPCVRSDADVPEAVRSRTSDNFPNPHARSILVDTPGSDSLDSGARHANCGDANCGLWFVYDATRLALGRLRLGLCPGVVPTQ